MKGNFNLLTQQATPTNSDDPAPRHAKYSRTGLRLSGAFLLVTLIASGFHSTALIGHGSDDQQLEPAVSNSSSSNASTTVRKDNQMNTTQDTEHQANAQPPSNNTNQTSGSVSTSITNLNGKTTVRVNGETIQPDNNGNVSKHIETSNGNVNIDVSQQSTGGNSSTSTSVHQFSSNASMDWEVHTDNSFNSP